jgi:hypothetical protein
MGTVSLVKPRESVGELLTTHIAEGHALLDREGLLRPEEFYETYKVWVARGETILDSCFRTTGGFMAVGPVDELRGTNAAAMLGLNLGTELPTSENVPIITGDLNQKFVF